MNEVTPEKNWQTDTFINLLFRPAGAPGPMKMFPLFLALALSPTLTIADNSTLDAAIGGGLGGAAGAAIGNEIGGRDAAIIGSALGAAAGTAANTDTKRGTAPPKAPGYHSPSTSGHPHYRFCPPGQAKKGRC